MTAKIIVKKDSISLVILRFLIVGLFRFFSGRPMMGKKIDNSSFTKGATHGKPGKTLTQWQKKPHAHRALIRAAVFWPLAGIIALHFVNATAALLVAVFSLPILAVLAYRKGRLIFFDPFTSLDAVNGVHTQHWILKNKWRRLLHRQEVPGLVTKRNKMEGLSPELEKALRDSINAEERGTGAMPVLKVTRYRRRSVGK